MNASPNGFRAKHGVKSIGLFCGASDGHDRNHICHASAFGRAVAAEGWRLVYGGGGTGLMGAAATAAIDAGGRVCGVIPQMLVDLEVSHEDLGEIVMTEDMHTRKHVMFFNADAFVVLPGGVGTLDEFFEILTWKSLSIHQKPLRILNCHGYWNPLLSLIESVVEAGFAERGLLSGLVVDDSVAGLVDGLREDLSARNSATL